MAAAGGRAGGDRRAHRRATRVRAPGSRGPAARAGDLPRHLRRPQPGAHPDLPDRPRPDHRRHPSGTTGGTDGDADSGADVATAAPARTTPTYAYVDDPGPLLGITAGYELFGFGPRGVVRVQFARGRVNVTPARLSPASGPVALLVDADRVVVRPVLTGAGFGVRDDGQVTPLTGALARPGPALPGPTPDLAWVPTADATALVLVDLTGAPAGPRVPVPAGATIAAAQSDGGGGLLFAGTSDVAQVGPDGVGHRTPGTLLADGPAGYLVSVCAAAHRCGTELVDRTTGRTRPVTGVPDPATLRTGVPGLISPNGRMAALVASGGSAIRLLDLATGRITPVPLPLGPTGDQGMVFAPDGGLLFVAGADGIVHAVDPGSGTFRPLEELPPLERLVIRAA